MPVSQINDKYRETDAHHAIGQAMLQILESHQLGEGTHSEVVLKLWIALDGNDPRYKKARNIVLQQFFWRQSSIAPLNEEKSDDRSL